MIDQNIFRKIKNYLLNKNKWLRHDHDVNHFNINYQCRNKRIHGIFNCDPQILLHEISIICKHISIYDVIRLRNNHPNEKYFLKCKSKYLLVKKQEKIFKSDGLVIYFSHNKIKFFPSHEKTIKKYFI